jgi:hypothetical protein
MQDLEVRDADHARLTDAQAFCELGGRHAELDIMYKTKQVC